MLLLKSLHCVSRPTHIIHKSPCQILWIFAACKPIFRDGWIRFYCYYEDKTILYLNATKTKAPRQMHCKERTRITRRLHTPIIYHLFNTIRDNNKNLSYDVAVIQWLTSCHKNHMTTRYITLGYWCVTS